MDAHARKPCASIGRLLPSGSTMVSMTFRNMLSRMNPSTRMANIKPWAEQKVAPGLGKGYNCDGGAGLNNGMEARNEWLPKTVNQLRVDTNPKMTFGLAGHEGPAMAKVVDPAI